MTDLAKGVNTPLQTANLLGTFPYNVYIQQNPFTIKATVERSINDIVSSDE